MFKTVMAQNSLKNSHPAGKSRKAWYRSAFEHISLLVIYTGRNVYTFFLKTKRSFIQSIFIGISVYST